MKKIKIIEMGGTISAKGVDRLDLHNYTSGVYTKEDFLTDLPELNDLAQLDFFPFEKVSSAEINQSHWLKLRSLVTYLLNHQGCDGIVISHGTSTMEETAYFLNLTLPTQKPVVFVGAQRPYSSLSSDAQLNLLNAVRVAADDASIGMGVLIMMNNEISSAREAVKNDTYQMQAFYPGQFGFLGSVGADGVVSYYRKPLRKHTSQSDFANLSLPALPEVAITYSYAGATGEFIRLVNQTQKYSGLVITGTGAGLMTSDERQALKEAEENNLIVVRSSRSQNGRITESTRFSDTRFIAGDNLSPHKARILLMLALVKYHDQKAIQTIFDTH